MKMCSTCNLFLATNAAYCQWCWEALFRPRSPQAQMCQRCEEFKDRDDFTIFMGRNIMCSDCYKQLDDVECAYLMNQLDGAQDV